MDHLLFWNPEDWTHHEAYEAMVAAAGGEALESAAEDAREARHALEEALSPEQDDVYATAADAGEDAYRMREIAATRVAFVHGLAVGAALARFPDEDAARLAGFAASTATVLLDAGLPGSTAMEVNAVVLDALGRADRVAARPRWTGETVELPLPTRGRPEEATDAADAAPAGGTGEE